MRYTAITLFGVMTLACISVSCRGGGAAPPGPAVGGSIAKRAPDAAEPPPSVEFSFYKVADLPVRSANLWGLEQGQILLASDEASFALLQGGEMGAMTKIAEGLSDPGGELDGRVQTITGRWPDAMWLVLRAVDRWNRPYDMFYERLFRLRGERWEQVHEAQHDQSSDEVYQALWQQGQGCLVGLLADDYDPQNAFLSRAEALDCAGQAAQRPSFKASKQMEYGIAAARGFASGDVLVLEEHPEMKEGQPSPPRLALSRPGTPDRTEIVLPLPAQIERERRKFGLVYCKLLGDSLSDLYIIGNHVLGGVPRFGPPPGEVTFIPLLLHFDGSALTPVPPPPLEVIGEGVMAADGTLVVLGNPPQGASEARAAVWALPRGGAWQQIEMPVEPRIKAAYVPSSIAARSLTDIWAVGFHHEGQGKERERRVALFHSHRLAAASPGASSSHR